MARNTRIFLLLLSVTSCGSAEVTITVTGNGSITSAPLGLACGSACSNSFPSGTHLLLTPLPEQGEEFAGWGGSPCAGQPGICEFIVEKSTKLSASFQPPVSLSVIVSGSGNGTITADVGNLSCANNGQGVCEIDVAQSSSVKLIAAASVNSTFNGWFGIGECGTASTCQVAMNSDAVVLAQFVWAPGSTGNCNGETWGNFAQAFFQQNCSACHTWNQSYEEVESNASQIVSFITSGAMPLDHTLSSQQKTDILEWFNCGSPQ